MHGRRPLVSGELPEHEPVRVSGGGDPGSPPDGGSCGRSLLLFGYVPLCEGGFRPQRGEPYPFPMESIPEETEGETENGRAAGPGRAFWQGVL